MCCSSPQTSRTASSEPLAFFQTITLCDLYVVILHSWASFFPHLLKDVQDNVGLKNTDARANSLDPSSVAPQVCDVG